MHNVFRNGHVHVCAEKCSTCIFHPGNLMDLEKGRVKEMVESTRADDAGTIPCHQTLTEYHGERSGQNAICRGWWDAYAHESGLCQMAERLGIVKYE
jgi:hypothetical protein